jgi:hypothetical protein
MCVAISFTICYNHNKPGERVAFYRRRDKFSISLDNELELDLK